MKNIDLCDETMPAIVWMRLAENKNDNICTYRNVEKEVQELIYKANTISSQIETTRYVRLLS